MPDTHRALRRGVYVLPSLVTTASLATAFAAMLLAVQGRFQAAAGAIFLSCLLDGLDGSVARLTRTSSEFGGQYDSLADVVAFGAAPALAFHLWVLQGLGTPGLAAGVLFLTCGALRLARFNVMSAQAAGLPKRRCRNFLGLPIPAAGCTLASLMLFAPRLPDHLAASQQGGGIIVVLLVVVLALLMVSRIPYASLKNAAWFRAHPALALGGACAVVLLAGLWPASAAFPLLMLYLLSGPYMATVMSQAEELDETPCPR